MDATEFRQLQPMLHRYLGDFADCFARKDTRVHLRTYLRGQLSNLERKSVEPIADAAGVPVRTLQEFLSQLRWDSEIALELSDRAVGNGVTFAWLTFDEWYGAKPTFLRGLQQRQQHYVGEVPKSFRGWTDPPEVTSRPYHGGRGGGRKAPRVLAGSGKARTVEELWQHDARLRKKR